MEKNHKEWTEKDFDGLSWHDNPIHAFRIRNPYEGYDFELTFEIDHILEWISTPEKHYKFSVAPATLTFYSVDKLKLDVEIEYKESMTIDEIVRKEITSENNMKKDLRNYQWIINVQSFAGRANKIQFNSPSFKQVLTKAPIITDGQNLQ